MKKNKIIVVGAGITGLMTALTLHDKYNLMIIDAGPDPRINDHKSGATYSGMDARHISFTETSPWTYKYRHELIMTDTRENGWLCIPKNKLGLLEKKWISEFQNTTKKNYVHDRNTSKVIELNKKGILLWEALQKKYKFLKPVVNTNVMPIICRKKEDLHSEFKFESNLDIRVQLYEKMALPASLLPFRQQLKNLGNIGYFTLYGQAYLIQTLCSHIIDYLESKGTKFVWNKYVSEPVLGKIQNNFQGDAIVYCCGISSQSALLLSNINISLAGIIGVWVSVNNPGITVPCKIYGPEPVNYINITPNQSELLLSGGYGFVGTRPYDETIKLAEPIMKAFVGEVKKWLPNSVIKEKAYCIRPSTPTGVPTFVTKFIDNKIPMIIAVGHCAGGFTQAPYTAQSIKDKLDNL